MKSLVLNNPTHQRLEVAFQGWLSLTGYAEASVYGMPNYVREFLHWIERENKSLTTLTAQDIPAYFFHLSQRKKQGKSGALSPPYLQKHLQALKRFSLYVRQTDQGSFAVDILLPPAKRTLPGILTKQEISQLYAACQGSPLGLRDRAMLALLYGCGLRRNEARSLEVSDFLPARSLVYVRHGKNYQERYVPLSEDVKQDLENYLSYGRSTLLRNPLETAFFISERGHRIQGQSLYLRFKQLLRKAGLAPAAGLHTLRHSIASHLHQSGMKLSHIARFLGHQSLESTQLYTHLPHEWYNGL